LRFEDRLTLQIIPLTTVNDESLFKPVQVIVDGFDGQRTPFAPEKLDDSVGRESFAHVFHHIFDHPVKQVVIADVMPSGDIVGNDRSVDTLYDLVSGTLVKRSQSNNRKTAGAQIVVEQLSGWTSAGCFEIQVLCER